MEPELRSWATHFGAFAGEVRDGAAIEFSYIQGGSITVLSGSTRNGGFTGTLREATIRASYSTAEVHVLGPQGGNLSGTRVAGMVGFSHRGRIEGSYTAGRLVGTVSGATGHIGGMVGFAFSSSAFVDSFCDSQAVGRGCLGGRSPGTNHVIPGYNTAQVQGPTDYTGIYEHWNLDLDNDAYGEYPWNFGSSADYPTLHTPAQRLAAIPVIAAPIDYDTDDNNLIDVRTPEQFSAMRWDTDGDGIATDAAYNAAFPDRIGRRHSPGIMGCPATCAGYELRANLLFPADTASPLNPWTAIRDFDTTWTATGGRLPGCGSTSPAAGMPRCWATCGPAPGCGIWGCSISTSPPPAPAPNPTGSWPGSCRPGR